MMCFFLLVGTLTLAFNVGLVRAQAETIYINSDGSVTPASAPISTVDNITYTFTGNITYPTYDGIVAERSNIVIDGNGFTVQGSPSAPDYDQSTGLNLTGTNDVTIQNVSVENFQNGIYLSGSNNSMIIGNNATANSEGIYLYSSSNDTVYGNNMANNQDDGVWLDSSVSNTVSGNNMTNDGNGVGLGDSSNNTVSENWIPDSGTGVNLYYSSNNTISKNNITNDLIVHSMEPVFLTGVWVANSSDNMISENYITNKTWGVWLGLASNNTVFENNITNNVEGIVLGYFIAPDGVTVPWPSNNNSIIGNNVIANSIGYPNDMWSGIHLVSSSNNTIYHNNFVENVPQILVDSASVGNIWDNGYPSGGNYWSDYNGTDLHSGPYQNLTGSDGIGDTPYVIDANNTDHYPLMKPYGFSTQLQPTETVYINSDGSVTPSNAPISSVDNVTYTLTGNMSYPAYYGIVYGIVVERNNVVIDGDGYTVQGLSGPLFFASQSVGLYLNSTNNVTIENANIKGFYYGIYLSDSNNSLINGDNTTANGVGIYLDSSSSNTVADNNAEANHPAFPRVFPYDIYGTGICLSASSNNVINGNNATTNSYDGIHLNSSSNNTVSDNNATTNGVGIYLNSSSNNTVADNNAESNHPAFVYDIFGSGFNESLLDIYGYGIYLSASSNNVINGNNATTNSANGIILDTSSNNTINDNNATANIWTGIWLGSSPDNTLSGNNVTANTSDGIYLYYSSGNTLSGNVMVGNEPNFFVSGSVLSDFLQSVDTSNFVDGKPVYYFVNQSGIVVNAEAYPEVGYLGFVNCVNMTAQGLNLTNNGQGLLFAFTNDSEITDNNIANNSWGIDLFSASGNTLSGNNVIANTYDGIDLYNSSNCSLSGNNITANSENGINLENSSNNVLSGNNVAANQFGIWLEASSDNTIYLNSFNNNTRQVYSSYNQTNVWDNGSVGNCWSDYLTKYPNAIQVNSSGVWNTHYVIDTNNTDNYPLMVPYAIIPEFPSIQATMFFMLLTLSAVIIYKKRREKSAR